MDQYFGIYCEQCGTWWMKPDGTLLSYPSSDLANAHMNDRMVIRPEHLWRVQQFGLERQAYIPGEAGAPLCPYVRLQTRATALMDSVGW